ncbi:hypothetical protein [Cryptosporangium minutisporangium]|uniref:Uncharacterized protein n=1 Tax=Cryptosporangium minutisporangium TaxID=113569 RepID=A0ABP6SZG9_9ACTN
MSGTDHSRAWSPGVWLVVTLLVLVEIWAAWVAMVMVTFVVSSTCSEPAYRTQIIAGEVTLLVAAAAGLVPWIFGAVRSKLPGRTLLAGVIAVSPLLVAVVAGLRPSFWVGEFCF